MIYPFPGLSMLIHIIVITIANIIAFFKYCYKKIIFFFQKGQRKKIVSLGIASMITLFVVATSYYVMYIALRSNTSNLRLMAAAAQQSKTYFTAALKKK